MIHDMIGGGGGAPLNFKVVGGTSAPASPKENTIWVNTDAEISSWAFSATEPETPAAGMVWITTDKKSTAPFNALKKNNITVYPISAKQYIRGAWVDKTAKSYQNGAWVDWWNGHLYEYGNLYEKFTGGWTTVGYKAKGYNCQAWFRDNHIEMYGTNGAAVGGAGTVNKMDLSGHTKLHILVDVNYADTAQLSVLANKSDDIFNAPLATAKLPQGTAKTVSLDISSVTEAYVAVGATSTIKVYDIWLE